MEKPKFVYVTYINTTPEKLWEALTTTDLIRQYWSGRTNESKWKKGAVLESHTPKGELVQCNIDMRYEICHGQ